MPEANESGPDEVTTIDVPDAPTPVVVKKKTKKPASKAKKTPPPGEGHNGGPPLDDEEEPTVAGPPEVTGAELKGLIERIERLTEEKQAVGDDIKEVFSEAKVKGYDVKIMRKVLARRKVAREKLTEEEMLVDTYERALESEFV